MNSEWNRKEVQAIVLVSPTLKCLTKEDPVNVINLGPFNHSIDNWDYWKPCMVSAFTGLIQVSNCVSSLQWWCDYPGSGSEVHYQNRSLWLLIFNVVWTIAPCKVLALSLTWLPWTLSGILWGVNLLIQSNYVFSSKLFRYSERSVASTGCMSDCSGKLMKSPINLSPAQRDPDWVGHEAPAFWCNEYQQRRRCWGPWRTGLLELVDQTWFLLAAQVVYLHLVGLFFITFCNRLLGCPFLPNIMRIWNCYRLYTSGIQRLSAYEVLS